MEKQATYTESQIARRRTFAIISHPDAGKTTLTEKFLLYGGAISLAGAVKSRKAQRSATSDWMELEKQRGISITSTVLQFEHNGFSVNLLDTPGHRDFSEDTYRVLTAVDSVVMVIDAVKGIEAQTLKLFEVCKLRGIPTFTFINKMDRPGRPPLELMDELERVLGVEAYPVNWPLGTGPSFSGVYSRQDGRVHLFERTAGGGRRATEHVHSLDSLDTLLGDEAAPVREELELVMGAGAELDREAIHRGRLSPVFFGSAMNNFGVGDLLDGFLRFGLPPQPRMASGVRIEPDAQEFSGFIFKIQANLDPQHRNRIAFVRVCSGRFTRDLDVYLSRTGKRLRLSSAHKMFGRERETLEDAWPGDIIGIVGHADFRIGDTLSTTPGLHFDELPTFAPEVFAYLHGSSNAQYKRFRDGLSQLLQEGVVQSFETQGGIARVPLLGAVGALQLEVVQYRLKSEYGAEARLEPAPWHILRWLDPAVQTGTLKIPTGARLATDGLGNPVILFEDSWVLDGFVAQNPNAPLREWSGGAGSMRSAAS